MYFLKKYHFAEYSSKKSPPSQQLHWWWCCQSTPTQKRKRIVAAHNSDAGAVAAAAAGSGYGFTAQDGTEILLQGQDVQVTHRGPEHLCFGNADGAFAALDTRITPVLEAEGMVPSQPGLFFQGDNAINGGLGNPFGDGMRCAGGDIRRFGVIQTTSLGDAS